MYVAVYWPHPGFVVSTVAAPRVTWRHAHEDLVPLVVRGIEAACAENACVIGSARLAAVCGLAILEDVSAGFSPCCLSVLCAFHCALGIAQAPWFLGIRRRPIREEEGQKVVATGEGAEEDFAQLSVSCRLEAIVVSSW